MTTSILVTECYEKTILVSAKELKQVICIQYPIAFLSDITQNSLALDLVSVLLHSGSEINIIHLASAEKLGFVVQTTNIDAQKIDATIFETYGIIVLVFSVTDQASRVKFFRETFLVANISQDVIFGMLFFTLSSANVNFLKREL